MLKERYYQTRIIVDKIISDEGFYFIIPGWDSKVLHYLGFNEIPVSIRETLSIWNRLYAKVNLKAENKADIKIKDWDFRGNIEEQICE